MSNENTTLPNWLEEMTIGEMRQIVHGATISAGERVGKRCGGSFDIHPFSEDDKMYLSIGEDYRFMYLRGLDREGFLSKVRENITSFPTEAELHNREIMEAVEKLKQISPRIDDKLSTTLDQLIAAVVNEVANNLIENKTEKADA